MGSWGGDSDGEKREDETEKGLRVHEDLESGRRFCSDDLHASPRPLLPVNKERFCCGNRCLSGPEPGILLLTVFLLSAPAVLVVHDVLPQLSREAQLEAGLGFALLLAAVFGTLFAVAFSDPGILPREHCPAEIPSGPSRVKFVVINGVSVPQKWCATCCLYRPPRAKHCSICDTCVRRFDHHCPWVSNCIGQRNYRVFFFFVFFAALYALAVAVGAGVAIVAEINSRGWNVSVETIWQAACDCPRLAGLFVYGVCCSIPLLNLCCFNVYLVGNNLTTNEEILQLFPDRNPYSSGYLANVYHFFSHRVEPSLLGEDRPLSSSENASLFCETSVLPSTNRVSVSPEASSHRVDRHGVLPQSDRPGVDTPASAREIVSLFHGRA